ncbi:MAG TPA: transglycosylase domain-containing protein [Stellaceae bacterium]|jgi:membrane peptidoglycan carboxypeptidase
MVEAVWGRLRHGGVWRRRIWRSRFRADWLPWLLRAVWALRWATLLGVVALLGWGLAAESRTSFLQSLIFTRLTRNMSFAVAAGPSPSVLFPKDGPYDERLGYAELPRYIAALGRHQFAVAQQARWSPALMRFVRDGGYTIYHEKPEAGLKLFDTGGGLIYRASYPERTFAGFGAIPPLVVNSLLFIEDKDLLDPGDPDRNPAVDWPRFILAAGGRVGGVVDRHLRAGGASTLATQTEKFLHSPAGRTPGSIEKLRQMATASARAYLDGRDTTLARRHIVTTYLNSEPFASRPGFGEVIGVPEALWRWYGTDLAEADRVLTSPAATPAAMARKAEIYRQVLSLLLAGRRPAYYLLANPPALAALTDRYLHLLEAAGTIDPALAHAALATQLHFIGQLPPPAAASFVGNKAVDTLRAHLVSLLHLPDLYALDRLDLTGYASVDTGGQKRIVDVLQRLGDPDYDRSLGLYGKQLLGGASPAKLAWSVVLYERGADRNYVRIRADSLNEPFDINSGAKLQLGSTAKLRTLITYLDIVADLHKEMAALPRDRLTAMAAAAKDDPIAKWSADYLAGARDKGLQAMVDAAMQRTYSAAPAAFFTGGGMQSFGNFEKWENHERPTVAFAFAHSINDAFIRLMRDIVAHETAAGGAPVQALLSDRSDPERMDYLHRFADQEGRRYLDRFWRDYRGLNAQEALDLLASRTRPNPRRLAAVFRSVRPEASRAALAAFLSRHLPKASIDDDELWDIYRESSPRTVSLRDRAYIAGVHPLELWLVDYMQTHPAPSRDEVVQASAAARQEVYRWLFDSRSPYTQNLRIKTLLEQDAFEKILLDWRRQGYPFSHLVPSDGTAIGSSGDRPDALADLMGIIVNDGVRVPTVSLKRLDFAVGTPYETDLTIAPEPQRVLAPEVARTVRRALLGVVADGTANRLRGIYRAADGSALPVGGKTGTGDNRFDRFGRGGRLVSQRIVDRTATFVFFLGDRFFGTVTAYVPGKAAGQYHFTSALAVQLLKALKPQLDPLLTSPSAIPPVRAQNRDAHPAHAG